MRTIVVGGGIAGLACANRLARLGVDVTVLEADRRAGGVIRTGQMDGYTYETGPQTCIATPAIRALARELGLALVERPRRERARWLVRGGRLVSPLRAMSAAGILRALFGLVRKGAPPAEDETVAAYATRRFGREAARRLFDPLVSGIFAGDAERLSQADALARFGERRGPSVTFEGGMGALPLALARALGPALRLGSPVAAVTRAPDGARLRLVTDDGGPVDADAVVLACPADVASWLVGPLDPFLAKDLASIRYNPVTTVAFGFDARAFPHGAPRGFGFLAAREEGLAPLLGCLFCPAPAGKVALRAIVRGAPPDAVPVAEAALRRLLRASAAPEAVHAHEHRRGLPQYEIGHAACLRSIDERLRRIPGLRLAGNAYRTIPVGGVVEDAEGVAEAVAGRGRAA